MCQQYNPVVVSSGHRVCFFFLGVFCDEALLYFVGGQFQLLADLGIIIFPEFCQSLCSLFNVREASKFLAESEDELCDCYRPLEFVMLVCYFIQ